MKRFILFAYKYCNHFGGALDIYKSYSTKKESILGFIEGSEKHQFDDGNILDTRTGEIHIYEIEKYIEEKDERKRRKEEIVKKSLVKEEIRKQKKYFSENTQQKGSV